MHVVDAVVHDGRRHVLPGDTLCPGGLHVQVESGLAAILAGVFQVPLVLEVGVVRLVAQRQVLRAEHQRAVASLAPLEANLL